MRRYIQAYFVRKQLATAAVVAGPLSFLTGHLRARSWWYEIVALDVRLLLGGALTPVIQHTGLHITVVLMIMITFLISTRDIDPYLNKAWGGVENMHSTDVESISSSSFVRLYEPAI